MIRKAVGFLTSAKKRHRLISATQLVWY